MLTIQVISAVVSVVMPVAKTVTLEKQQEYWGHLLNLGAYKTPRCRFYP